MELILFLIVSDIEVTKTENDGREEQRSRCEDAGDEKGRARRRLGLDGLSRSQLS